MSAYGDHTLMQEIYDDLHRIKDKYAEQGVEEKQFVASVLEVIKDMMLGFLSPNVVDKEHE